MRDAVYVRNRHRNEIESLVGRNPSRVSSIAESSIQAPSLERNPKIKAFRGKGSEHYEVLAIVTITPWTAMNTSELSSGSNTRSELSTDIEDEFGEFYLVTSMYEMQQEPIARQQELQGSVVMNDSAGA